MKLPKFIKNIFAVKQLEIDIPNQIESLNDLHIKTKNKIEKINEEFNKSHITMNSKENAQVKITAFNKILDASYAINEMIDITIGIQKIIKGITTMKLPEETYSKKLIEKVNQSNVLLNDVGNTLNETIQFSAKINNLLTKLQSK
jgi:hypothetical protein